MIIPWLLIGICHGCGIGFNCFQESIDKNWVTNEQDTIGNCASTCEQALNQKCDETRSAINLATIKNGLNLSCISTKNNSCWHLINDCNDIRPRMICPCKPKVSACLQRINYWRELACTEKWQDCPSGFLSLITEQPKNRNKSFGCKSIIDNFMIEHYRIKKTKSCKGNCSHVLKATSFSWTKNQKDFIFNWDYSSPSPFQSLLGDCNINNGGCDPLTSCNDTGINVECGQCPMGFSGNGSIGCADINECLSLPCATNCTNVNLTNINYTYNNVCVCLGNDCTYIQSPSYLSGSYICDNYAQYSTRTWSAVICDRYVQENNSSNNITLQSIIRSNITMCDIYVRWNLYNANETLVFQSVPFAQLNGNLTLPSNVLFGLPSCVTVNGCTKVLNCGLNLQCLTASQSCYNSTTGVEIRYDITNTSTTTCPLNYGQPSFTACANVNGNACTTLSIANPLLFYIQGKYICQSVGANGCVTYWNSNLDRLTLTTPFIPDSSNCQVFFLLFNFLMIFFY